MQRSKHSINICSLDLILTLPFLISSANIYCLLVARHEGVVRWAGTVYTENIRALGFDALCCHSSEELNS